MSDPLSGDPESDEDRAATDDPSPRPPPPPPAKARAPRTASGARRTPRAGPTRSSGGRATPGSASKGRRGGTGALSSASGVAAVPEPPPPRGEAAKAATRRPDPVAPIRTIAGSATADAVGTAPPGPVEPSTSDGRGPVAASADTIPEGLPDFRDNPPPLPDLKDTPRADPHPDAGPVRLLGDPPAIVAFLPATDAADGPLPDLKDTPRADPHPAAGVVRTLVDPPAIVEGVLAAETADETAALPDLKDTPPPVPATEEAVPTGLDGALPVVAPGQLALPPSGNGRSRRQRPAAAQPVPLGALSSRQLDGRATAINLRRLRKLEPGFGSLHRLRSLLVLVVIVALIAAAFAAALDIVVSIISVFANHAISKSAGS